MIAIIPRNEVFVLMTSIILTAFFTTADCCVVPLPLPIVYTVCINNVSSFILLLFLLYWNFIRMVDTLPSNWLDADEVRYK